MSKIAQSDTNGYIVVSNEIQPSKVYTVPDDVDTIETCAFSKAKNITKINLNNTQYVNNRAFYNCINLVEVTGGNNVEEFGEQCFYHCFGLKEFTFGPKVTKISGRMFEGATNLKTVIGTKNIVKIEDLAFYWCENLENFIGFTDLKYIGDSAFTRTKLTSFIAPNTLRDIGNNAFALSGLTDIQLNEGLEKIGRSAFFGCNMNTFIMPDSVSVADDNSLKYCQNLKHLKLSKQLMYLSPNLCADCCNLENHEIPESVDIIRYSAYENCKSLTHMFIGNNVEDIHEDVFNGCDNLAEVALPKKFNNYVQLQKIFGNKNFKRIKHGELKIYETPTDKKEYDKLKEYFNSKIPPIKEATPATKTSDISEGR